MESIFSIQHLDVSRNVVNYCIKNSFAMTKFSYPNILSVLAGQEIFQFRI